MCIEIGLTNLDKYPFIDLLCLLSERNIFGWSRSRYDYRYECTSNFYVSVERSYPPG